MRVTIQNTLEDWLAFNKHLARTLPKTHRTWFDNPLAVFLFSVLLAGFLTFVFNLNRHFHMPTALGVAIYLVLFAMLYTINFQLKVKKSYAPKLHGVFIGEHTVSLDESGITSVGHGYQSHHAWHVVKKIERVTYDQRHFILLYLDTCYAMIFPEHQLSDPDAFYQQLNHYTQQSQ